MRAGVLAIRSFRYYRRTNLAVALGVVTGAAVLTGALLVGDSMRGSLKEAALARLGRVDVAVRGPHFFRADLGSRIAAGLPEGTVTTVAPVIMLRGAAVHAESRARAGRINVLGVDDRYWALGSDAEIAATTEPEGRTALINERLAAQLGASAGDDILVSMGKPESIAVDSVLGRKDAISATLRVTVAGIVPDSGLGGFTLNPQHHATATAFVPLATLQRTLDKKKRANVLLADVGDGSATAAGIPGRLADAVSKAVELDDLGLHLRQNRTLGYVSLESDAMLIPPAVEQAAMIAAHNLDAIATPILTHLANSISVAGASEHDGSRTTPYSTVAAIEPGCVESQAWLTVDGKRAPIPGPGEIVLNDWTAVDIGASVGDRIELRYYVAAPSGRLGTEAAEFTLTGVVKLAGAAADPGLTPRYPGITDVRNIADWDPPFPVDLTKVRDKDEAYWDEHQATPKAFVSLADGRRLFESQGDRFGSSTSIRLYPPAGVSPAELVDRFTDELHAQLDAASAGFAIDPVRSRALESGAGSTDFGGLFIGFSFFLIASALMLIALLFRLGAERRADQLGLMLAVGLTPRRTARLLLSEGLIVAVIASAIGLVLAGAYAWLMLAGLRTWWADAVNAPFLRLHGTVTSYTIGYAASVIAGVVSMAWAVRGLTRKAPRVLLSGAVGSESAVAGTRRSILAPLAAAVFLAVALALVILHVTTQKPSEQIAFFGSGGVSLLAFLAFFRWRLRRPVARRMAPPGTWTLARIGVRNARRHPGRSLLTAGLIASATFLIVSLEAFRVDVSTASGGLHAGTGGFALYAESAVGLPYDLNDADGREKLGIAPETAELLDAAKVVPFRLHAGDETSCLNLYKPAEPRILGATDAMLRRGGFSFGATLATGHLAGPDAWSLLEQRLDDGAVPAIGDEAAVKWQLHLGLGKKLPLDSQRNVRAPLEFVALLEGSALQSEVIVWEPHFLELFPDASGYAFFLIEVPADRAEALSAALERDLQRYGFDVGRTADRLRDYLAVQNTYLATFQTLGGFGLVLGVLGVAAVLLRNVWERRSELALMQALGFTRRSLGVVVMAENAALIAAGLLAGVIPALIAVAPHVIRRPDSLPWSSIGITLAGVVVVGMGAGLAALTSTLRGSLLAALRSE